MRVQHLGGQLQVQVAECLCKEALQSHCTLYTVQCTLPYDPNVHLLQQVGLFQRGFLLITLPCSTSTYHTLALPQMWTWVAFKRIFDCLRKEGCEAYDIGTGKSCADPFLWRWCKTLPNRTWRPILVNIGPWLTRYLLSWDHFTRIFRQRLFALKAMMSF